MKLLVAQVQAAGAAGVTDLDRLTRELMQKLGATSLGGSSSAASTCSGNSTPDGTSGLLEPAAKHAAAGGHPKPQQRQPQQSGTGNLRQGQGTGGLTASANTGKSRIPGAPAGSQPGWR